MVPPNRRRAVYIVGPSATGKTTLCRALAIRLGVQPPAFITEVARTVMRSTGFSRKDVRRVEMQRAIMKAQILADGRARATVEAGEFPALLGDRSAIDPIVYAYLAGEDGPAMAASLIDTVEFQEIVEIYRESTFVLLSPVPEWVVDDGVRSLNDGLECLEAFRHILGLLRIPFIEFDGICRLLEERVSRVIGLLQI